MATAASPRFPATPARARSQPRIHSAERHTAASPQPTGAAATERLVPREGEMLLVVRPEHVELIMNGTKTLGIRARRVRRLGSWFLAASGIVHGKITLGAPFKIEDEARWAILEVQHREGAIMQRGQNFCWAYPLSRPLRLAPLPFVWAPGAMMLCKYRTAGALHSSDTPEDEHIEDEDGAASLGTAHDDRESAGRPSHRRPSPRRAAHVSVPLMQLSSVTGASKEIAEAERALADE